MASKDSITTKEEVEKHAENNNVVVASDRSPVSSKEEVVKDVENKTVVVASDDNTVNKEDVETKATTTKVVLSDKNDSVSEEQKDEKEKGIDLDNFMEKLNLGPKKKLLVLPIGGFLVHRAHRRRPKTIPRKRQPDFSSGNFMIYKRPHCEELLKFCFERFEVGIWSSAMEHNISGVLTNVMGELKSKLLFTWDQNECTETDYKCLDDKYKPMFFKELKLIWKKQFTYLPWSEGEYSASNTLLISDPVKALLNPPNTAIFLEDYNPRNNQDDVLGPNGELRAFLDELAEAKDVQTYVKAHPIGEPAITPSHVDWNFYSKIISVYGKNK